MTPLESEKQSLEAFRETLKNLPRPEVRSIECATIRAIVDGKLAEIDRFISDELKRINT